MSKYNTATDVEQITLSTFKTAAHREIATALRDATCDRLAEMSSGESDLVKQKLRSLHYDIKCSH